MNNENKISAAEIVILFISIVIPQFLFFCLVPKMLECRLIVYILCTFVSIANVVVSAVLWVVKGMRIAAAPVLLGFILMHIIVGIGTVLLMFGASAEAALVILLTAVLIYALIMLIFINTLEK